MTLNKLAVALFTMWPLMLSGAANRPLGMYRNSSLADMIMAGNNEVTD